MSTSDDQADAFIYGMTGAFGDALAPHNFIVGRCIDCRKLTWAASGARCPALGRSLPCGGQLLPEDTEVQDAFRTAYRLGGWPAVYAMIEH